MQNWFLTIQKQMRHRPATGVALFVDLLATPFRRQGRRDDGTGPKALTRSATFTSTNADEGFAESFLCIIAVCSGLPIQRIGSGRGRNARATESHSRAISIVPWQFTLENCQLPPASPQSSLGKTVKGLTYSLNPLWGTMLLAATEKHFTLVQKLWRMRLPCGRLRKKARKTNRGAYKQFQSATQPGSNSLKTKAFCLYSFSSCAIPA